MCCGLVLFHHHHGLRRLVRVFFGMVHIFDGRAGGVPRPRAGGAAKDGVAERPGFATEGEGGDVAVIAVFPVFSFLHKHTEKCGSPRF